MAKAKKAASGKRKRRGVQMTATGLTPTELLLGPLEGPTLELSDAVKADGGAVLCAYREPLGGRTLLLVALPIEAVSPTPFQRDVSDAHVRKLVGAMDKTKRFLDPIIAVRHDGRYFTPNGNHRLTALRELGTRTVIALLVPEASVAYQILALNIEKAHNLRERATEVVRMVRDLGKTTHKETDFELELEEPSLVTLGFAYEARPRLAGGAYHSALRKVDAWIVDEPFPKAIKERERRAERLLQLDDAVTDSVKRLKERGLTSPYLRSFVVARVNPLRFMSGELPTFDELMDTMTKRARGMKTERIEASDLASSGGAPDEA